MLKYRVLTAIVLLPLVIWGIWSLPPFYFALASAMVMLVGAWEYSRLAGIQLPTKRWGYVVIIGAIHFLAYWLPLIPLLILACLSWAFCTIVVWRYEHHLSLYGVEKKNVKAVLGGIHLVGCWVGLNALHNSLLGPLWLLFALIIVWDMDTGAYFAGRLWGKHLLAPNTSPKKTWEGLIGGFVVTAIVSMAVMEWVFYIPSTQWLALLMLVLVSAGASVVGDLYESMLKRLVNLKDSGTLLPGHGGMLDRIDSVLAAIPLFALGMMLAS
ncbi:MAG TPA: phosphatidate cytidylyltransferase [Coxiellaceae bacterium]|nr:phosphatidate cytidylyltransferase [Coxiellaceae bacterium]